LAVRLVAVDTVAAVGTDKNEAVAVVDTAAEVDAVVDAEVDEDAEVEVEVGSTPGIP